MQQHLTFCSNTTLFSNTLPYVATQYHMQQHCTLCSNTVPYAATPYRMQHPYPLQQHLAFCSNTALCSNTLPTAVTVPSAATPCLLQQHCPMQQHLTHCINSVPSAATRAGLYCAKFSCTHRNKVMNTGRFRRPFLRRYPLSFQSVTHQQSLMCYSTQTCYVLTGGEEVLRQADVQVLFVAGAASQHEDQDQ